MQFRMRFDAKVRGMFREVDSDFAQLMLMLALLLSIGLVAVYSSTIATSETEIENSYIWKHGAHIFIAVLASCALFRVPLRVLGPRSLIPVVVVIILLLFVHIPGISVGEKKGAMRWLELGYFTLQPSELAKPILLVYICHFFAHLEDHSKTMKGYLPVFCVSAVVLATILSQRDLGTAVLLASTLLAVMLMSRTKVHVFLVVLLVVVIAAVLLVVFVDYRISRIEKFLTQEGYHHEQAKFAFALGGLFGRGIGMSSRKWSSLPEAESDSIIAIIAEESGLVGIIVLLLVYVAVVLLCFNAANAASRRGEQFQSLLAKGIAILFSMQAFFHIAGNMALLPLKGLTLPLISLGGSSILAWMCTFALLLQIIRKNSEHKRAYESAVGGFADG